MATSLGTSMAALRISRNNNNSGNQNLDGYLNGIIIEAQSGARAFRNHVTITLISRSGREKVLTERRDGKDLPLSAYQQRQNYDILTDAYLSSNHFGVNEVQLVYDNKALLYTNAPIKNSNITLEINQLRHARINGEKVVIKIENTGILDLNDPVFFTASDMVGRENHDLRTFYEIMAGQAAIDEKQCVSVGKSLYINVDPEHQDLYFRGTCFINGFSKNSRIIEDNGKAVVKLIADPLVSLFFAEQLLSSSYDAVMKGKYFNRQLTEEFLTLYHNVRVQIIFNKTKILIIDGLSSEPLEKMTFVQNDGSRIYIMQYFENIYGFHSRAGKMPALKIQLLNGQIAFYPLDACKIISCQKVPLSKFKYVSDTLNEEMARRNPGFKATSITEDILKKNAVDAPVRFDRTTKCFSFIGQSQKLAEKFNVKFIYDQKIKFQISQKPQISFAAGTLIPDAKTSFELRGKRYVDPSSSKKWLILTRPGLNIQEPIKNLLNIARIHGLNFAAPDITTFNCSDLQKLNWDICFADLKQHGYTFVLMVDQKDPRQPASKSHDMLKLYEQIYDIQTEYVYSESLAKKYALENIVLKMNVKNDGLNYNVLVDGCLKQLYEQDKLVIFGWDVAHPSTSSSSSSAANIDGFVPSVVGFSFNGCKNGQSFNGNYYYQEPNTEMVNPQILKKAVKEGLQLRAQQRPNAKYPEMVFVYRDGLSEGQIMMAKNQELEAIKAGFAEYYGGADHHQIPKFIMVLATKRHNRRFYTSTKNNVQPGTIATDGIARLGANEFYLQSAYPIKGTSKLPDYEIICNEANLPSSEIQKFSHALCYSHQITSSAVSLPEPVFQAHELAKRGMNNFKIYRDVFNVPNSNNLLQHLNDHLNYTGNELMKHRFSA